MQYLDEYAIDRLVCQLIADISPYKLISDPDKSQACGFGQSGYLLVCTPTIQLSIISLGYTFSGTEKYLDLTLQLLFPENTLTHLDFSSQIRWPIALGVAIFLLYHLL
jgi:hypothetical protein